MLRPGLVSCSRLLIAHAVIFTGCANDLDLEAPIPATGTDGAPVEALFDPTNPIPVLRFVPTPTILAQKEDGTLDPEIVLPAPCELPAASQCLGFTSYWPTSTPITLQFSGEVNLATLNEGVELYEVSDMGVFTRVPIDVDNSIQVPRAPPGPDPIAAPGVPSSCPQQFGYTASDVIPGFDVIIRPMEDAVPTTPGPDLKFGTQYIVLVKSGEQGGLRDMQGNPIEPSGLFFLLNTDDAPVTEGEIPNALLRSQVQNSVLEQAFGGALYEDLTPEERAQVDAAVAATTPDLLSLYGLFQQVIGGATQNGVVTDRGELILVNTWTTGPPPSPTPLFDPLAQQIPFPNSELLMQPDEFGVMRVALPASGAGPIPPELVPGLNKLDGFSLRTPPAGPFPETGPVMLFETQAGVDLNTAQDGIVMIPLDAQGAPQDAIALNVTSTTGTSIIVQPVQPLAAGTTYVVAVTNALKRAGGGNFAAATTFDLLKTPVPFIEGSTVAESIIPVFQCAPLLQGQSTLATPDQVATNAMLLEPLRARWQPTFAALEAANIPRTEVLLAWSYTTHSVTGDVDQFKAALFNGDFDDATPRVMSTNLRFAGTATVAALIGVVDNLCVPLCLQGGLPGVATDNCVDAQSNPTPEVVTNPVCQLIVATTVSDIGAAELFMMRTHRATSGDPFVDGTFDLELLNNPESVDVPVWVVTPTGDMPNGGYPVAIFQHGLGQQKEDGFLIANAFAQAGWATIMMDLPLHGARASDVARQVDIPGLGPTEVPCEEPVDPADVVCDTMGMCTGGCDGVQDSSGTGFSGTNFPATRDNFRQSTLDQLTLVRTIQQEGGAGPWSMLNPNRIGYVGQSLGGFTGANLLAYLDNAELDAAVLNVAGADLTLLTQTSILGVATNVALNAAGLCEYNEPNNPASGCMLTEAYLGLLALADWAIQAGDPAHTASAAASRFGASNILMQVSVPDPVVPNVTSESLRDRLGLTGTDAYQVYDFSALPNANVGGGCHGFILAAVCGECLQDALCTTAGAQAQAVTFIGSGAQIIGPRVPDQIAGQSCTDPCGVR